MANLLTALGTAKGAAAATILAAGVVGTGVVATNTDIQTNLGLNDRPSASASARPSHSGQPAIVDARNDADKTLREAFQDDQKKLEKLRSTHVEGADRGKLNDIVKTADEKLRDRLTKALDDVAALTLGREGHEPSASASAKPSGSPDVKASFTPATQAAIDAIVKAAIADMDKITADAEAAVGALPTAGPKGPAQPSAKPTR